MSQIQMVESTIDFEMDEEVGAAAHYSEVDRRSNLSLHDFKKEYLYPGKPVVITDVVDNWPAYTKWTFDYFKSQYGNEEVRIWRYDKEKEFTPDDNKIVSLAEYIEGITSGDWDHYPYYLRDNWRMIYEHAELKEDYTEPKYFFDWYTLLPKFLRMPYPRLFFGPKGAVTPLHIDVWKTHAWLSQLKGRKRWLLYSPEQETYLYDCNVQVDKPNLAKYPLFREAQALETTLEPGDTIFVPSGWAHWVVSLDTTMSLTGNYMGPGCFSSCLKNTSIEFLQKISAKLTR